MGSLQLRRYRSGDELAIRTLYRETFGLDLEPAHWRWKYLDNPAGQVYVYLAFDGDRCVGQYAMLPMSLCDGGEETATLVALDNMVHPDYQRRGIAKRLEARLAAERPTDIPYYTFLNENSFPMYVKDLGWTYLGPIGVYMKPVGVSSLVARSRLWSVLRPVLWAYRTYYARRDNPLKAEPFHAFDAETDALWTSNRALLGPTFNRSRDQLKWRFEQSPVAYEMYKLRRQRELVGWAVVRVQQRFGLSIGWLMDLFVEQSGQPDLYTNALLAVQEVVGDRCDFLALIAPRPDCERALRKAGFHRVPRKLLPHDFFFCVRRNDYPSDRVLRRDQWYLSWSLHDAL